MLVLPAGLTCQRHVPTWGGHFLHQPIMRPSKSVDDLELKSVKKKYKNAKFAAGCSREVIEKGAEMLGWTLDDLISDTIIAMREIDVVD